MVEAGLYRVYNRFARGKKGLASQRRDKETSALRKTIAAVGVERWGQRPGQLAALLNKHPVAVSRWVSDSARKRQEVLAFGVATGKLDEALSGWALEASKRNELAREFAENQEENDFVNFVPPGTDAPMGTDARLIGGLMM